MSHSFKLVNPASIEQYIVSNQLPRDVAIEKADFWKCHQVAFIIGAKSDHANWCDVVGELDALLHKDSMDRKKPSAMTQNRI